MFDVYVSSPDDHGYFQDHVESLPGIFRKQDFYIYIRFNFRLHTAIIF